MSLPPPRASSTARTPTTTIAADMTFTECPRWHGDRWYFVGFYSHRVRSMEADGGDLRTELTVPAQPSGLGWLPDGRLLAVSMKDRRILRREPDGTVVSATPTSVPRRADPVTPGTRPDRISP